MLVHRTERIHCPGVGRNSRQGDPGNNTALSSTCGTDNGKQPCHRLPPQMTFPPFSIHPGRGCPRNQNQPKAPAGTPAFAIGHSSRPLRALPRAVPRARSSSLHAPVPTNVRHFAWRRPSAQLSPQKCLAYRLWVSQTMDGPVLHARRDFIFAIANPSPESLPVARAVSRVSVCWLTERICTVSHVYLCA
jgi:hypothetical protein